MPHARRSLVSLAGFYFLNYGALGALFPFLPLLLAARGLDAVEVSRVMVLIPLFNLLVPPLWGALADALRARVLLLRLASLGCAGVSFLLWPSWPFAGAALAVGALSFFRAPIASLADAATCAVLGGRDTSYGRVRVWGSIGFALFAAALGRFDPSRQPALMVATCVASYAAAAAATLGLPPVAILRERGVVREAARWALHPAALALLVGNAAYYIGHAAYDAFFSLHLRALGFGDGFVGGAWAAGVVTEIAVMFLAPPLLVGERRSSRLLCAAACVAALRWWLLTRLVDPAAILAQQSLHGVTFGVWYLALVHHVQAAAPERLRTTVQSLAAASIGLGAVASYTLGGSIFARAGGGGVFRLALGASAVALGCYLGL